MDRSEKFWDRAAKTYDRDEMGNKPTTIKIIEKTREYLDDSDILLDYGCGTGRISIELAGAVREIHGLDTASKMIEIARNNVDRQKLTNIDFAHATLFDERYQAGTFDVILAFYVLHLLENANAVINRMNELLRPGGMLISVTPCLGEKQTFLRLSLSFLSKIGLVPGIHAFRLAELKDAFLGGNFEIIETECIHPTEGQYFIAARKL